MRPRVSSLWLHHVASLALLVVAGLLGLAAGQAHAGGSGTVAGGSAAQPAAAQTVVVPNLVHQAYVFAKGILLDGGYAWTVDGPTQGFPGNLVQSQSPAPGTRVVLDGTPTIRLRLVPNPGAPEICAPEGGSPYSGTEALTPAQAAVRAQAAAAAAKLAARKAEAELQAANRASARAAAAKARQLARENSLAARLLRSAKATAAARAGAPAPGVASAKRAAVKKAAAAEKLATAQQAAGAKRPTPVTSRPLAFRVARAPLEPPRELPLPARATQLARWIAGAPALTAANRHTFLFQHAWVVTGARFGWWRGAEALRILVAADTVLARRWRSAAVHLREARVALAEVERLTAAAARAPAARR